MADLPVERLEPSPPFSYIGMDCFGPFEIKEGRKVLKRYGLIFSCMYSRAVHVEMLDDMSTDALINSLRTFIALRGKVRHIFCDKGTNFVGASNEFSKNMPMVDDKLLKEFLLKENCDFVFNSPHSSHMGGSWERLIQTFRNVLKGLMLQASYLNISSTRTLFYEAMNIVNSRPLTTIDSDDSSPLTPNHLIQMKSSIVLPPPPARFDSSDQYSRKR
jgi:hypothetical protein